MRLKQWIVEQLTAYPTLADKTNVVFSIAWRLNGSDGPDENAPSFHATAYGSVAVNFDPDAPYTPYDQLTQEQVLSWVKDALGTEQVSAYETSIDAQLDDLANPKQIVNPLPWSINNG